jgi:hypothetical protein
MEFMRCGTERRAVTVRYPCESQGHGIVMDASGLELIVTRCNAMHFENNFSSPLILGCGVPVMNATETVEEQIMDFLDGRTHGEDLLHALHDHVLDEPVPERMRALLRAGSAD